VVLGPFLVPCGQPAELLHPVDHALDDVAPAVDLAVKGPASPLCLLPRDRQTHAVSANVCPDLAPGVALVTDNALRMQLGPPTGPFDRTLLHQGFEHGGFMTVTRCERQGHEMAVAIDPQMHFGAETTAAAA